MPPGGAKKGGFKLKSDLLKNAGGETIVSDKTSIVSINESHQY